VTAFPAEAAEVLSHMHLGHRLDAMPDDLMRAQACRQMAAEARNRYMQGKAECQADILLSTLDRYRNVSAEARKRIGERMWSTSTTAKEIASDEQMFSRWAIMYDLAVISTLGVR